MLKNLKLKNAQKTREKERKKLAKRNSGITLIALVITIIVLLILAGVSIAMLTGENGILTRANDAKVETRAGTVEEKVNLWKTEKKMAEHTKQEVKEEEQMLQELLDEKLVYENEINRENKIITIEDRQISYNVEDKTEAPSLNGVIKILNTKSNEDGRIFLKSDSIGVSQEEAGEIYGKSLSYLIAKYNISLEEDPEDPSGTIRICMIYLNEREGKNFKTIKECKEYIESLSEEEQQKISEEAFGMLTGKLFYMYIDGEKVNLNMHMDSNTSMISFKISEIENLAEKSNITFELNLSGDIKSAPIHIERYAIAPELWEEDNENLIDGFYIYDRYEDTKITDVENVQVNVDNSGWKDITEHYKSSQNGVIQISNFFNLGIDTKIGEEGNIKIKFTKNSKEYSYEGTYYFEVR